MFCYFIQTKSILILIYCNVVCYLCRFFVHALTLTPFRTSWRCFLTIFNLKNSQPRWKANFSTPLDPLVLIDPQTRWWLVDISCKFNFVYDPTCAEFCFSFSEGTVCLCLCQFFCSFSSSSGCFTLHFHWKTCWRQHKSCFFLWLV